jgi:two-component system chemotaxis response regulator CheB
VIGVVLSGTLDDGTIGLATIIDAGGIAVVQDPDDALYPSMPQSAIEHVRVDHVAPAAELPALLTRLAAEPAPPDTADEVPDEVKTEVEVAAMDPEAMERSTRPGRPSGFGCPECGGSLFLIDDHGVMHFRCRVGHAWSMESLLAAQGSALEAALWTALRALEEQSTLADHIAGRLRKRGSNTSAQRFEEQATDAREHARVIRAALEQRRSAAARGARGASVARPPFGLPENAGESA